MDGTVQEVTQQTYQHELKSEEIISLQVENNETIKILLMGMGVPQLVH